MSLFSYPIGREAPVAVILDDTSATPLVTAGENGAAVVGLRVSEVSNNATTVTLAVHDASDVLVAYICATEAIDAKEIWHPVTLDGVPIILPANHVLKATAGTANRLHVTGAYIEPPQL